MGNCIGQVILHDQKGEAMTTLESKWYTGNRVICIKNSPDVIWYRELGCKDTSGNAICIAALLYHVDDVVWTTKLECLLSISREWHPATDFVHEVDIVGEGYVALEETDIVCGDDEHTWLDHQRHGKESWEKISDIYPTHAGRTLSQVRKLSSTCLDYIIRRKISAKPEPVKRWWYRNSDGVVYYSVNKPDILAYSYTEITE